MNRIRMLLRAVLVGAALTGPIAIYTGAIVSFGIGFQSSYPLSRYAAQTLLEGSVFGFIAGIVCGATGCRAWRSALWSGGIILLIELAVVIILIACIQPLAPQQVPPECFDIARDGIIAALVGYFTARISFEWERRAPAAKPKPSPGETPVRTKAYRYHL